MVAGHSWTLFGTPISRSPPIYEMKESSSWSQVKTFGSDPLFKMGPKKRQITLEITRILIKAELLLSSDVNQKFNSDQLQQVLVQLEAKFQELYEPISFQQYLMANNFHQMFPAVAAYFGIQGLTLDHSFKAYADHQLVINQVLSMASQLARDIHLTNHKYVAHQLALLYQAVNQCGERMIKFKPLIEAKFDSIKSVASEGVEVPHLKADQKVWLRDLTHEIVLEILSVTKNTNREMISNLDRLFSLPVQ